MSMELKFIYCLSIWWNCKYLPIIAIEVIYPLFYRVKAFYNIFAKI